MDGNVPGNFISMYFIHVAVALLNTFSFLCYRFFKQDYNVFCCKEIKLTDLSVCLFISYKFLKTYQYRTDQGLTFQ